MNAANTPQLERSDFIRRMPKAELHVHLEGAIGPRTLLDLARRRRVDLPASDVEGIERWFAFRDFDQFLEIYLTVSRCLRDPEDFQLAARSFLEDRARQNILYTEAHFTISTHVANGANPGEVADALAETVSAGEREHGVVLRWIPDIVRNVDYERADQTLEWALEHRDKHVVALGLAGKEESSAQPFREHFALASEAGLRRTVHAGEQCGPEAIWEALEACGAERIGHGFRSIEDPRLVEVLVDRQLPLEVCPTSNVALGLVPALEDHPLGRLRDAGVRWSLGSDDPALFGTTLTEEIDRTARILDLDRTELARLSLAALRQAFVDGREQERLLRAFREWFTEQGVEAAEN